MTNVNQSETNVITLIPEPDTLVIRMTRVERRIANELRKAFGGFRRVIIDVDDERHEFGADSLIQMLEDYEDAQGMNKHMKFFGTPERAARTLEKAELEVWDYCAMVDSRCDECRYEFDRYGCCDPTELLEWLRGDAE